MTHLAKQPDDRRRAIARFNLVCWIGTPIVMTAMLMLDLHAWPREIHEQRGGKTIILHEYHDFAQFYLGATTAWHGAWDSLYPIPNPNSNQNPGMPEGSTIRPRQAELATQAGVPLDECRFIAPPPFALAIMPLAWFDYNTAKKIWTAFLILCSSALVIIGGRSYEIAAGQRSRAAGLVAMLAATSPVITGSLRFMNVSPILGVFIGVAVLSLMRGPAISGALAIVGAGTIKYVSAVLLPLYVAMRKWKAIVALVVAGIVVLGVSWLVMGSVPFRIFFTDMLPHLDRANPDVLNGSLLAVLMRMSDHHSRSPAPLHGSLRLLATLVQWLSLAAVLALIFRQPRRRWEEPAAVLSAAALLICWFLICSPLYWGHYVAYLIPFWGWLIWEAKQSLSNAVMAAVAILYPSLPDVVMDAHILPGLHGHAMTLAGPYASFALLATLLICIIAVRRLALGTART